MPCRHPQRTPSATEHAALRTLSDPNLTPLSSRAPGLPGSLAVASPARSLPAPPRAPTGLCRVSDHRQLHLERGGKGDRPIGQALPFHLRAHRGLLQPDLPRRAPSQRVWPLVSALHLLWLERESPRTCICHHDQRCSLASPISSSSSDRLLSHPTCACFLRSFSTSSWSSWVSSRCHGSTSSSPVP